MERYDVIVLGGGSGGYVAAIRAAQLGGKVAIVEKDKFGGTCLNRGCIPTKTFVKSAEIIHNVKSAEIRGITAGITEINMEKMLNMKNMVVQQLSDGVRSLLKANGVRMYEGVGTVADNETIVIDNEDRETTLKYNKLIIATGSENFIPSIPGIDDGIMTSTELLNMAEIPKSLVIIGGGVIGCEFATIYEALGTEVTIVELMPRLISNMDEDLSKQLEKSLKKKKVKVLTNHGVQSLEKTDVGYKVCMSNKKTSETVEIMTEKVLVSVGRRPNLMGLENLNLEKNRNYILVDEHLKTSADNIYAIGDITGTIQLAHVASAQGMVAAENSMGGNKTCPLNVVPGCIYTLPGIGSVGMTETEAREKIGDILVGKFPVAALGKALAMGESEGSYKIIADAKTKKVLGVHIFGAGATDLIMEAAVVMQAEGTLEMITETIHAHPTMAEGLMEVAHAAEGLCIHMPPAKK